MLITKIRITSQFSLSSIVMFLLVVSPLSPLWGAGAGVPDLSGYLSAMPSVIVQNPGGNGWWQGVAHNRLNFGWQFAKTWRFDAGVRNRLIIGSAAMIDPAATGADAGWADLSWNWLTANGNRANDANRNVAVGNTAFDRLFVTFEKDRWKLQIGRQRINWGQTFVWNPNDIFNTYSFFDFDYVERAGCDAIRATFFHNETASSELAVSVDSNGKTTVAALHHWNRHGFDYQIIAGEQAESDLVVGGAWSGDFKGLNFRGEFSYFHPLSDFSDKFGIVAFSVGLDYMFSNSLMIQIESLYNNIDNEASSSGLLSLYAAPMSAKRLSISEWNIFAQASYPITPRLNGTLSSMWFADLGGGYAGLSLDYSLAENLDLSAIGQFFATFANSSLGSMNVGMYFARLKWSF